MNKNTIPIFLDEELICSAKKASQNESHSADEQIEQWVRLGLIASRTLNTDALMRLITGTVTLTVSKANPDCIKESTEPDTEIDSDIILELLTVWELAISTFGSDDRARTWLNSELPAQDGKPIRLLSSRNGRAKVMAILRRLALGDFGG